MENIVQGVSLPGEGTYQEYDLRRALTDEPKKGDLTSYVVS